MFQILKQLKMIQTLKALEHTLFLRNFLKFQKEIT